VLSQPHIKGDKLNLMKNGNGEWTVSMKLTLSCVSKSAGRSTNQEP